MMDGLSILEPFSNYRNNLNLVTGELKEPSKNLPRAVIIGPSVVIICYVFVNIAYCAVLPADIVMNSKSIAMASAYPQLQVNFRTLDKWYLAMSVL